MSSQAISLRNSHIYIFCPSCLAWDCLRCPTDKRSQCKQLKDLGRCAKEESGGWEIRKGFLSTVAFPTTTRHPSPRSYFSIFFFLRFSCFISRVPRLDDLCSSARVPVNMAVSPWSHSLPLWFWTLSREQWVGASKSSSNMSSWNCSESIDHFGCSWSMKGVLGESMSLPSPHLVPMKGRKNCGC